MRTLYFVGLVLGLLACNDPMEAVVDSEDLDVRVREILDVATRSEPDGLNAVERETDQGWFLDQGLARLDRSDVSVEIVSVDAAQVIRDARVLEPVDAQVELPLDPDTGIMVDAQFEQKPDMSNTIDAAVPEPVDAQVELPAVPDASVIELLDPRGDEDHDGTDNRFDCQPLNPAYSVVESCNDGIDNNCDGVTDTDDFLQCPQIVECSFDEDCLALPLPPTICHEEGGISRSIEYFHHSCSAGICVYDRQQTMCNHGCAGGECLLPEVIQCESTDACAINESCWQGECVSLYDPATEFRLQARWDGARSYQCEQPQVGCEEIPLAAPETFDNARFETVCADINGGVYFGRHSYLGFLPSPRSTMNSYFPRNERLVGCFITLTVFCEDNLPCWDAIQLTRNPETDEVIDVRQYGEIYFAIDNVWYEGPASLGFLDQETLAWWIALD